MRRQPSGSASMKSAAMWPASMHRAVPEGSRIGGLGKCLGGGGGGRGMVGGGWSGGGNGNGWSNMGPRPVGGGGGVGVGWEEFDRG